MEGTLYILTMKDGYVEGQAMILDRNFIPGYALVEWYSWLFGDPTYATLLSHEKLSTARIYRDRALWREQGTLGMEEAQKARRSFDG